MHYDYPRFGRRPQVIDHYMLANPPAKVCRKWDKLYDRLFDDESIVEGIANKRHGIVLWRHAPLFALGNQKRWGIAAGDSVQDKPYKRALH
ncbi:MAG: hypothetical protein AAF355_09830 [Myxococcota bacterium]